MTAMAAPATSAAHPTAKLLAGAAGLAGLTFTGTTAGCYDIEVSNPAARKKTTDQARICVQERAAPVRRHSRPLRAAAGDVDGASGPDGQLIV